MTSSQEFSFKAPAANPVFYRTYSRKYDGKRETWQEVVKRNIEGMTELGQLTPSEVALLSEAQLNLQCLPSGRWMWVGGSEWIKNPNNFSGAYNCTSTNVVDWDSFGLMMDLAMMGSGTGAILEPKFIEKLPAIRNKINIVFISEIGTKPAEERLELTEFEVKGNNVKVVVGDSRHGWITSYQSILEMSSDPEFDYEINVSIDLTNVRPAGERLNGFGGVANPIKLKDMYGRLASILNNAIGRQLTSVECCLLIDEAAVVVVAGNVRRSAGMRQFNSDDQEAAEAKDNLWQQTEDGSWRIDPKRDALRMANHTRVFHTYPSYKAVEEAVTKQFYSGEGAIQFAPEAIARSNVDLLTTEQDRETFIGVYCNQGPEVAGALLKSKYPEMTEQELEHRLTRYGLNPCVTGDTKILTVFEGPKTFEELALNKKDVLVWCVNKETNEAAVSMMRAPRKTRVNVPILEIEFDSGLKVRATPDHNFFTLQRNKVQAKDLKEGQSVAAFAIHQHRDGHLRIVRNNKKTNTVRQQFVHRIIAAYHGIEGEVIHHEDGDPLNNHPTNLVATTALFHNKEHYANRVRKGFYHGTPGPVAQEVLSNHKVVSVKEAGTADVYNGTVDEFHNYVIVDPVSVGKSFISGILSANCGEITGSDFHCNLSEVHLNNVDPFDYEQQQKVFEAGAIAVATLLNHSFVVPRYALSRSLDPIVGVSFTGLFDFFVHAFGTPWLKWWEAGRPDTEEGLAFKQKEAEYLSRWKEIVHTTVWDYCNRHGLRRPNRCTTVQPAGTKSLLTNASPGWHPPKAQRFIRRITFRRDDPVALACMEYGYTVVPSQSDKDEEGRLLDNPFDPRCTEWLVEIPTEVSWANIPGADEVEIGKFSALAQFDFYMQVQKYYTAHNTSATIEYRENEIEDLSEAIYDAIQNNKGYISAALLARFDANETFPRLPFEPISKEKYDELQAGVKERQITSDFFEALLRYDNGELLEAGPAGCDGDKCLLPLAKPE